MPTSRSAHSASVSSPSTSLRPGPTAIFRALLSLIFLVAGMGHVLQPEQVASRLLDAKLGFLATAIAPAEVLVLLSGIALIGGSLALLTGFQTRLAAMGLIVVLIPITLTIQVGRPTLGPLFKNIAILGGLLFFVTHGSSAYSIDAYVRRRKDEAGRTNG